MRPQFFSQLCAIARREGGEAAEDIVQDALLAAVRAGRSDLADVQNARWLRGVVRNQARMARRSAGRRRQRETSWERERSEPGAPPGEAGDFVGDLPPALRIVASLVLTGHNRAEIAWLLDLSDAALRQRVTALRRRLGAAGLAAPTEFVGLGLDLAYGRIRGALLPLVLRQQGAFASHDPDGHLFVVRRSQNR